MEENTYFTYIPTSLTHLGKKKLLKMIRRNSNSEQGVGQHLHLDQDFGHQEATDTYILVHILFCIWSN